jgi:8-oxo-dGTP diphosphatase
MSWATCAHGHNHWGRRGAAGLLVADGGRMLLQLRAGWSHQGGTWSIPGGARERGETAVQAALREADEELGIDPEAVTVRTAYVANCGGWTYETVLAVAQAPLRLQHHSETEDHAWVESEQVEAMPLHPAFRTAWTDPARAIREFVELTRP